MARALFNVFVFPYRRAGDEFKYALLRRSDAGFWQGISGGGEDDETPLETFRIGRLLMILILMFSNIRQNLNDALTETPPTVY
jgi:hypothetical protein